MSSLPRRACFSVKPDPHGGRLKCWEGPTLIARPQFTCYLSTMLQRVHVVEAIKHPWRLDMAKVIEAGKPTDPGYDGFIGRVLFEETPSGLKMSGYRRRSTQPNQPFEPRLVVFTPWTNVKWVEYADPPDALALTNMGDGGNPPPRGTANAKRERPLGTQP